MAQQLQLHELHGSRGARFVARENWRVPADYGDVRAEHAAIRESVAVVDLSDSSRILIAGPDAPEIAMAGLAGPVDLLGETRAMRTLWTLPDGAIADVLLLARSGERSYLAVGSPAGSKETLAHLCQHHTGDSDTRIDDRRETTCWIAITGPRAAELVGSQLSDRLPRRLEPMQVALFEFDRYRTLAVRTSETGEDGFLVMAAPAAAQALVEHLAESGARLAGRDAWDMARVEAGIAAMHPDLEGGLTPGEARLDRLFNVESRGGGRRMVGLIFGEDSTVHSPGTPLEREGQVVGILRSCVPGPTIGSIIAIAVVEQHHAAAGTRVTVADDTATIVTLPFLRRRTNE